ESQRKYAEARDLYLRLLAQRPEAPEVLAALARLALDEGDLDTVNAHARKLLGLAAELEPWDGTSTEHEDDRREVSGALLRVAVPLLGAHRSAETQEALKRLRALFAEHAMEEGVALALLEEYDRAGKAAEAEQLLAHAARAHPGSDGLLYALGNAQDRAGLRQKALSTMRKVLSLQ